MSAVLQGGEEFTPWIPLPNINDRFNLEEVKENGDGLFITLMNESERPLRIDVASPLAYRSELRELNEARWTRLEAEPGCGVFWKVESSSWVAKYAMERVAHYLVLTPECAVEFLTDQAPHISWLDNFFGDAV